MGHRLSRSLAQAISVTALQAIPLSAGPIGVAASPRIGQTTAGIRLRSSALPLSALCFESYAILYQASGQTFGEFKSRDSKGGMIAVHAVRLHSASVECLRRAMIPEQSRDAANSLRRGSLELGLPRSLAACRQPTCDEKWKPARNPLCQRRSARHTSPLLSSIVTSSGIITHRSQWTCKPSAERLVTKASTAKVSARIFAERTKGSRLLIR